VRKLAEPFEREFTYGQKEISRNIAQLERHERNAAKIPDLNARTTKLLDETQERNRRTSDARKRIESLRAEAAALESFAKRFEPLTDATFHGFAEQLERVAPGDGKGLFGSSRAGHPMRISGKRSTACPPS
jgi:chromosome segregation ATPase